MHKKLSIDRHFNEKLIKAKKGIGIIKYLSKFFPLKTLDQMYIARVCSHLDYCNIIYHMPALNSQNNLGVTLNLLVEKVERTQYQAALAITRTCHGYNRSQLYEELGWEILTDRRWCRRILQILKIKNVLPPGKTTPKSQTFIHF